LKIPTEELLWSNYVSWIGGEIESEFITFNGKQFSAEGVRGRLNRTYPSLIRDLHFLYLLEYSRQFEVVEYSMKQDYYNGLDLKVERSGKKVFVSLFVDTSRARFFKGKKSIRHDYSEVEEIVFNVQFDSLTLVGSVYLLNNSHVELLVNLIDQYVLSKS
jgi:hypothetical protein